MKSFEVVISKNGVPIKLTEERWSHIVESHDYMAGNQDLILETIESPDYIVKGKMNELIALKYYKETNISPKHVVVIYSEGKRGGFIITAFMTSKEGKILGKEVLWRK